MSVCLTILRWVVVTGQFLVALGVVVCVCTLSLVEVIDDALDAAATCRRRLQPDVMNQKVGMVSSLIGCHQFVADAKRPQFGLQQTKHKPQVFMCLLAQQ